MPALAFTIAVNRLDLRLLLSSLAPVAALEEDQGIVLSPVGSSLVATAAGSGALVGVVIDTAPDWQQGPPGPIALAAPAARAILAAHKPPADKDARTMWENGLFSLTVDAEGCTVEEVDDIVGSAYSVTVPTQPTALLNIPHALHTLTTRRERAQRPSAEQEEEFRALPAGLLPALRGARVWGPVSVEFPSEGLVLATANRWVGAFLLAPASAGVPVDAEVLQGAAGQIHAVLAEAEGRA